MEQENWRPVVGYEGRYLVSDKGRIKSIFGRKNPRSKPLMRKLRLSNGYWIVDLKSNWISTTFKVARIVAAAFHGPCPEGMEVAHLNGNPQDDRIENLSYTTHRENMHHKFIRGTHNRGSHHSSAKLTDEKVIEILRLRASGMELKPIAKMFGVTKGHVCDITKGRAWKYFDSLTNANLARLFLARNNATAKTGQKELGI